METTLNKQAQTLDQELRKEATEAFNRLGFPSTKNEEWKYVNLQEVLPAQPDFSSNPSGTHLNEAWLAVSKIAGNDVQFYIFENGTFRNDLSSPILSGNIVIAPLSTLKKLDQATGYYGKTAMFGKEPFVALNTAVDHDGMLIHIKEGVTCDKPIHLLFINSNTNNNKITSLRNLIVIDKNASATVIESYHSHNDECNGLTNVVNEIIVGENAQLNFYKAQLDNEKTSQINFTQAVQSKNSTFDTVTVTAGGHLVRNNLHIKLNDTNCTSHLFGLYLLDGNQVTDNHTLVDHAKPNCFSNELYKGIIGGKASGIFNGKILVREDAQKTNAYQSNKNILLSDEATMNTKPQLEIYADDVKCTHGATTGQMDEEALFYLRSRGIGETNAKTLLNIAFAGDVLNNIKHEALRERLTQLATQKLQK